jgi:hypothetical protein
MEWSSDTSQADWVRARLSPFDSGIVTSVVPEGYPAYAKIFHPAFRGDEAVETVRWSEVAAWSGLPMVSSAQFPDVALPERMPSAPAPWSERPDEGTLAASYTAALVETLSAGSSAVPWWFCVWEGFGWEGPSDPVPPEVREGPRVRLPHRDYLIYHGGPRDAFAFVADQRQTPNLWWPADHSWSVATEIDLAWTYVGGSRDLIEALVADPRIEAVPVSPEVSSWQAFPLWVTKRAELAAREVQHGGEAVVETPYGILHARVRLDDDGEHVLTIDRRSFREVGSGSSRSWSQQPPSAEAIVRALCYAVIDLVP